MPRLLDQFLDRFLDRSGFAVLLCAIVLHMLWGATLLVAPNEIMTSPFSMLINTIGQQRAGTLMLSVATLACFGISRPGWKGLILGTFQNVVLWISASSGIIAAIRGAYPDGVVRSHLFIFADQLPIILFAMLHAVALILYHGIRTKRAQAAARILPPLVP